MSDSFGARLRQRRERQEIALVTIAEQTKIKLSLLEALERDDVSHWPSGIFRRAFIRAYAHAIGLNPDDVVREFLEVYPDPLEVVETDLLTASGADGGLMSGGPPIRLRYLVGSAIGSLSRLRRSPAVDDPVVAGRAPVNVPVPWEPALPSASHAVADHARVDRPNAIATDRMTLNGPVSSVPDLAAVAYPSTDPGQAERTNEVDAHAALGEAGQKTSATETAAEPALGDSWNDLKNRSASVTRLERPVEPQQPRTRRALSIFP